MYIKHTKTLKITCSINIPLLVHDTPSWFFTSPWCGNLNSLLTTQKCLSVTFCYFFQIIAMTAIQSLRGCLELKIVVNMSHKNHYKYEQQEFTSLFTVYCWINYICIVNSPRCPPKHSKAPQSLKLYPHLINNIQSEQSAEGAKRDVEKSPKCSCSNWILAPGSESRPALAEYR